MEFRQLRYFLAVAETGNIGRAAERLNVSQPPVSRQIQALETEAGAALLLRTPKGVELTDAGRTFAAEAERVLSQAERTLTRTRASGRGEIGKLEVGFFGSPIYRTVPLALRAFHRARPDCEVALTRIGKREQMTAIREGRLHIGFARYYAKNPDLKVEQLGEEKLYAAVPEDLAAMLRGAVSLEQLAEYPLVLFPAGDRPGLADEVIRLIRERGVEPDIESVAEDAAAALALVASGTRVLLRR